MSASGDKLKWTMSYQVAKETPRYQHEVEVSCIPDPHGSRLDRQVALRKSICTAQFLEFLKRLDCTVDYQKELLWHSISFFKMSIRDQRSFSLKPCRPTAWYPSYA